MSREDLLSVEGTVTNVFAGGKYSVSLKTGQTISAKISGRMRKYQISVIIGDKVTVGLSPYDFSHGLIISREKLSARSR
ncbi:translation initiation factor IF-1 [Fluviispira multicolorata]|uniref:Translation initiation factor IF-1 n=1 Tax=Fluviispira multicolorata TaxID=2654512 RepID=A0A833N2F3_9BACT|nr:translation initiation factor IF-1 [Fluviispira multicolorata]KAB8032182.1 translation initiation factor IF-1 [Fluviispira multicolorata]